MSTTNATPPTTKPAVDGSKMQTALIPLTEIKVDPRDNARTRMIEEKIISKMESLTQHGQLQPVRVRPNPDKAKDAPPWRLVFGFYRVEAARRLGWPNIKAEIAGADFTAKSAAVQNLIENIEREDLTEYDLAMGCRRLGVEFKMSTPDIMTALGKSKSHINSLLYISEHLDPRIKDEWKLGNPWAKFDRLNKIARIKDKDGADDFDAQWAVWQVETGAQGAGGAGAGAGSGGSGTGVAGKGGKGKAEKGQGYRAIAKNLDAVMTALKRSESENEIGAVKAPWVLSLMMYVVGKRKRPPEGIVLPVKAPKGGKEKGKGGK